MLPPIAEKKLRAWIRSHHLIYSGHYLIFESFDSSTVERFGDCIESLGGTLICVNAIDKMWVGNHHHQVILYQAKASLLTPNSSLKHYWIKNGSFHTKFDRKA